MVKNKSNEYEQTRVYFPNKVVIKQFYRSSPTYAYLIGYYGNHALLERAQRKPKPENGLSADLADKMNEMDPFHAVDKFEGERMLIHVDSIEEMVELVSREEKQKRLQKAHGYPPDIEE